MSLLSDQIVRIQRPAPRASALSCIIQGPLVHHFFLAGILAGCFGIGYLGSHLWLSLTGQTEPRVNYQALKQAHALIQLYAFVGIFILGFLLQAAPKVFEGRVIISRRALLLIPSVICGVALLSFWPEFLPAQILVSGSFLAAICFLAPPLRRATTQRFVAVGLPLICGLCAFAVGPFLRLDTPAHALFVLWAGVGSIIFSASQQFISGALGGKRMKLSHSLLLVALLLASSVALGLGCFGFVTDELIWRIAAALCVSTILVYALGSQLIFGLGKARFDSLSAAFGCAIVWAVIGSASLYQGAAYADLMLHTLATGWATPLMLAISCRVTGFLGGAQVISERSLIALILLWQAVPLLRGNVAHAWDPRLSWVVMVIVTIVLGIWAFVLLRGIIRIYRRQFQLRRGEEMVQC